MNKLNLTRLVLATLLITLIPVTGLAQISFQPGLKFGLNFSRLSGDLAEEHDIEAKTAISGGACLLINLNNKIALQTELLYTQKGGKSTQDSVDVMGSLAEVSNNWRIDYLEIPVLVKYKFPSNGIAAPGLYIGPAVDIRLNADVKTSFLSEELEKNSWDEVKNLSFCFLLGGDIAFDINRGQISFDFRYIIGLTNILDSPGEAKTGVVSMMMGYNF